ncbi:MAG: YqhA family protein [Mariprofundaceae bacterium]
MERLFETILWNSRFVVLLAVVSSMFGALLLFVLATVDMAHLTVAFFEHLVLGHEHPNFHVEAVGHIIQAVDDFLLATVLLIFSLGLYELFISKIDVAHGEGAGNILIINTLDDLKDRLGKVVLMILVVVFFKNVLHVTFDNPLNILYMGAGILLVSLALYFTHKSKH